MGELSPRCGKRGALSRGGAVSDWGCNGAPLLLCREEVGEQGDQGGGSGNNLGPRGWGCPSAGPKWTDSRYKLTDLDGERSETEWERQNMR